MVISILNLLQNKFYYKMKLSMNILLNTLHYGNKKCLMMVGVLNKELECIVAFWVQLVKVINIFYSKI